MGTYTGSDKRLQYLFQNGGGGGGTTVIANPAGAATDTLNKLQVGQTIYNIPSGGGGSFSQTLLYENTNFASAAGTANITKSYTLLDSLDNYDAVIVYGFMYNVNTNIDNNRANLMSMMVYSFDFYDVAISQGQPTTNPFLLNGSLNSARRSLAFQFPDSTHITTVALRTEAYVEPILYKVVGLKF